MLSEDTPVLQSGPGLNEDCVGHCSPLLRLCLVPDERLCPVSIYGHICRRRVIYALTGLSLLLQQPPLVRLCRRLSAIGLPEFCLVWE